ncbi:MAG: hypothetical protein M3292_10905 [Actinomycetota bacterium]|nr:hypothetical protein [Actinomycetota bacterium]
MVLLSFAADPTTATSFVWVIGPVSPGLLMRTEMTRFIGSVWPAAAFVIAA